MAGGVGVAAEAEAEAVADDPSVQSRLLDALVVAVAVADAEELPVVDAELVPEGEALAEGVEEATGEAVACAPREFEGDREGEAVAETEGEADAEGCAMSSSICESAREPSSAPARSVAPDGEAGTGCTCEEASPAAGAGGYAVAALPLQPRMTPPGERRPAPPRSETSM